ncbi:hypothetical protein ABZ307_34870 [Streptomyces griseorubiginosus]|uniref:hypothetical protein n=1 Tax=Streptomyces griseorubiginosus TaxID=67304 RepID=UPI0033AE8245
MDVSRKDDEGDIARPSSDAGPPMGVADVGGRLRCVGGRLLALGLERGGVRSALGKTPFDQLPQDPGGDARAGQA